ncbi:MAG TPA: SPFH domain-containing protein [Thermoanaerobaculia bacterium]|nr:SPFH domain-containing protein [Thermoanaerobaculia bacterium]
MINSLGFGWFLVLLAVGVLAVVAVGYVVAYLAFLKKAGPNEVIVVSGRGQVKFITGGADMVIPLFHTWDTLSLEVMTLEVTTPEVYTSQGVPIAVDGVAQIKIKKDEASLQAAAERFLGKDSQAIAKIALETVQGHLRGILGTLSVENIYMSRDQFAQKVQEISAGDLANMGLGIDSFTIRDIRDKHGYLEALGKPRIAEVQRTAAIAQAVAAKEAAIAQADAERETRERQAEAQLLAQEAEARRDAGIAEANADRSRRQQEAEAAARRAAEIANSQAAQAIAEQQAIANRKKAEAEMAYELQKKTVEIQVQEQEIKRKEKELDATIRRQADARRYEIETLASAERQRVETTAEAERARLTTVAEGEKARGLAAADVTRAQGLAQAEAERARGIVEAQVREAVGLAEAESRKAQGLAEAAAMEKKAAAWRQYSEAAVLQILAPVLPEIARALGEPLAKIDRITLINSGGNGDLGVSRLTGEMAKVIAQVPPLIESLTGMNLEQLFAKVRATVAPADGKTATPIVPLPVETAAPGVQTVPAVVELAPEALPPGPPPLQQTKG